MNTSTSGSGMTDSARIRRHSGSVPVLKFIRKAQMDRPACAMANQVDFTCRLDRRELNVKEFFAGDRVLWGGPVAHHGGVSCKKSIMLAAFGVLYRLGFREVRLIGCDWRTSVESAYGHSHKRDFVDEFSVKESRAHFRFLEQWFAELLPMFRERQIDASGDGPPVIGPPRFNVLNCTDGGELETFERRDWREFC